MATSISSFVLGPRGHRLSRYFLTSSSNAAFTFETCRNDSQVRAAATNSVCGSGGGGGQWGLVALAWVLVGVPLLWGIWNTLLKAAALFK